MTITSSEVVNRINRSDGTKKLIGLATDNLGRVFNARPIQLTTETEAQAMNRWIAGHESEEVTNEIQERYQEHLSGARSLTDPSEYQPQADFDRRMLAQFMVETIIENFRSGLSFFQDVEVRGGANANQRAIYLGVPRAEYDLVAKRFNDLQGALTFIDDEKNQVWLEPLPGWE